MEYTVLYPTRYNFKTGADSKLLRHSVKTRYSVDLYVLKKRCVEPSSPLAKQHLGGKAYTSTEDCARSVYP
jgi:hypothetical protein